MLSTAGFFQKSFSKAFFRTHQQLADRIGTKKSCISRVENELTDVQLSTLYKLFQGVGRKISVAVL